MNMYKVCLNSFLIYTTIFFTIYFYVSEAKEVIDAKHPHCLFNSLCTCSKHFPDIGIMRCLNVKLPKIPKVVNNSKIFAIHMENNGLAYIDSYIFQNTGLYRLEIRQNPLHVIQEEAFVGLERSLRELVLTQTKLSVVPNKSIRYLQKLKHLDLTENYIYDIIADDWNGLYDTLETLVLENNLIEILPDDVFSSLEHLNTLNLNSNNLKSFPMKAFGDGLKNLHNLLLSDNFLKYIPYDTISNLDEIKTLDLSNNFISAVDFFPLEQEEIHRRISLDELKLQENEIISLNVGAFQYFEVINKTYLDRNPLTEINDEVFLNTKIRELYIRYCEITNIQELSFVGLENVLEILDLTGNKIEMLDLNSFTNFNNLKSLILQENRIKKLNSIDTFFTVQKNLITLELIGGNNIKIDLKKFKKVHSLKDFSLSALINPELKETDFVDFGANLQKLEIIASNIEVIRKNVFKYVNSIQYLDLSENIINKLEEDAFVDISHSLSTLIMSHAFSSSVQKLPEEALRSLTHLKVLCFNNNKFRSVPANSFDTLNNLRILHLEDNSIEQLFYGTFKGDVHVKLKEIYLSFNNIKKITQFTFADLPSLEQLLLDDNRIEVLDQKSFMNLENLKRLNLKGNKISSLLYETFQNIPELEDLDLSYNNLESFEFNCLDQVGSVGVFKLNISHNKISELRPYNNFMPSNLEMGYSGIVHSNVKILDMSFNNLSSIPKHYFQPTLMSLIHLHLSHNSLSNATKEVFGNLPYLQLLDLSHNEIKDINFDTFRNTAKLQVLLMCHNQITELPGELFFYQTELKQLKISHNKLSFLPDNIFRHEGLEVLDLSYNSFSRIPLYSLTEQATSGLVELNLSNNIISNIVNEDQLKKIENLIYLDLSNNKLLDIDPNSFVHLKKLVYLDLSSNVDLASDRNNFKLYGLENSLQHLILNNVSLSYLPDMVLPNIVTLSLTYNYLQSITQKASINMSSLRTINLSYNFLTNIPMTIQSFKELRSLHLAGNPIHILNNFSFYGAPKGLFDLDIQEIPLKSLDEFSLASLTSLRNLKLSTYEEITNFNIPQTLKESVGLRMLEINVTKKSAPLAYEMKGDFTRKLRTILISGKLFNAIDKNILMGIRSNRLNVIFKDTGLTYIPEELFHNIKGGRNISLHLDNNLKLREVQNPSRGRKPNLPDHQFLTDLKFSSTELRCDCNIGWVEVWLRKKRQYLCGSSPSRPRSYDDVSYNCRHPADDIRNTFCVNKANRSLIDVLKLDIECGWSGSSLLKLNTYLVYVFLIIVVVM